MDKKTMLAGIAALQLMITGCGVGDEVLVDPKASADSRALNPEEDEVVRDIIQHEKKIRPFVAKLIEASVPLFGINRKSVDDNEMLLADLDIAASRLPWYFANGRIRVYDNTETVHCAYFTSGGDMTHENDFVYLNKATIFGWDADTFVHEAMHAGGGHGKMNSIEKNSLSLKNGEDFGMRVLKSKDTSNLISIYYKAIDAPFKKLEKINRAENVSKKDLSYLRSEDSLSRSDWAEDWARSIYKDSPLEVFGVTQEELSEIYQSEGFREMYKEAKSELMSERSLELSEVRKKKKRKRKDFIRVIQEEVDPDYVPERNLVRDGETELEKKIAAFRAESARLEEEKQRRLAEQEALETSREVAEVENADTMVDVDREEVGKEKKEKRLFGKRR